jgi:hypothetical protein
MKGAMQAVVFIGPKAVVVQHFNDGKIGLYFLNLHVWKNLFSDK